ncbi:MAG: hypothetical protein EZS28_032341 [Streblomastix strix]|uniref:Uncharacterized protein n=1 Tax=Streblomastix strix TaxID=222440 RepID=A0A5J4UPY6_9EUKA|nr:MAG: hypothetical protein EZS28_032341 [Streblomastix strix]
MRYVVPSSKPETPSYAYQGIDVIENGITYQPNSVSELDNDYSSNSIYSLLKTGYAPRNVVFEPFRFYRGDELTQQTSVGSLSQIAFFQKVCITFLFVSIISNPSYQTKAIVDQACPKRKFMTNSPSIAEKPIQGDVIYVDIYRHILTNFWGDARMMSVDFGLLVPKRRFLFSVLLLYQVTALHLQFALLNVPFENSASQSVLMHEDYLILLITADMALICNMNLV